MKDSVFVEVDKEVNKTCNIDTLKKDSVYSPSHYNSGKIEVIDFIEDQDLNFNLGNVVKYVSRAGKKTENKIEDLEKAKWYISREIERIRYEN